MNEDPTEETILQRMIQANATFDSAARTLPELGLIRNSAFERLVERGWVRSAVFDRDRYYASTHQRLAVQGIARHWIAVGVILLLIVVLVAMMRLVR